MIMAYVMVCHLATGACQPLNKLFPDLEQCEQSVAELRARATADDPAYVVIHVCANAPGVQT